MKSYNKRIDAAMMPSTFRWDARAARDEREKNIMKYAPLVMKVVNTFKTDDNRVGVFNKHDLIQSGFEGVISGYDSIIASEGTLNVAYLELRIRTYITRHLNYQATGVAIPEYQIDKLKAQVVADRIFGAWMYSFRLDDLNPNAIKDRFSDHLFDEWDDSSYEIEELNELLSDVLWQLSNKERTIISMNYGIGYDDKMTMKDIANYLGMSEIGVKVAKKKALTKLNTEKNALHLANFL